MVAQSFGNFTSFIDVVKASICFCPTFHKSCAGYIQYYLGWVKQFFARFLGRPQIDLGRAEIETFLSETAKQPVISNWQIQQARDALELYYAKFRGIPLNPCEPVSDINHTNKPSSICTPSRKPDEIYTMTDVNVKGKKTQVCNRLATGVWQVHDGGG